MKIRTQEIAMLTERDDDTLANAIVTLEMIANAADSNGELHEKVLSLIDDIDTFRYNYTEINDEE